jgi:hypothetical protein
LSARSGEPAMALGAVTIPAAPAQSR